MKPYGLPRDGDVSHPDVADIHLYGLASHVGHIAGPGGDFRSNFRSVTAKAISRRIWKRAARRANRAACAVD